MLAPNVVVKTFKAGLKARLYKGTRNPEPIVT
jgi:hypothetical protein